MKKRIIALILCIASLVVVFAGCAKGIDPTSEYKGQQITMYLTETIYDLDPINAYANESTRSVVSLLFDTLFTLDEKGKVKECLADGYTVEEKKNKNNGSVEYYMYITLKDTCWSDGTPVSADDIVYAWKRLLSYNDSYSAASLLFDIKNARAYNRGDVSEDDVGLTADMKRLTIQFEGPIDYEQFILNTTSLALAPLREDIAGKGADWAKKPTTMVCSGPFKLSRISFSETGEKIKDKNYFDKGVTDTSNNVEKDFEEAVINSFVLERNAYYYRSNDVSKADPLDKSVTPYKIMVDCAMPEEDIKEAFENGTLLYMGDIPMSLRDDFKDTANVKDSLSTSTLYFNLNNEKFAKKEVRQALSMAIDRNAIANALVFAEAADGFVPTGVFESNSAKKLFRDNADSFSTLSKNTTKATNLLASAGATGLELTLTYAKYDEDHEAIANSVKEAWEAIGVKVTLNPMTTIINNDYDKYIDDTPTDVCDNLYAEALTAGNFEVILLDYVAVSPDPFSVLAPFAKDFSGSKMIPDAEDQSIYYTTPHITGYDSSEYNKKIESAFAQKDVEKRSSDLHAAEKILMDDMPVIPVVFNKTAFVVNEELDTNNTKFFFWKKSSNYYGADTLKYVSVDDYDAYLDTCEAFYAKKYDSYRQNPLSYFGGKNYKDLTFDQFKEESSNYAYLFKRLADYKMSKETNKQ